MACFFLPFLVVWAFAFFSQMRFHLRIAPQALSKWADENGVRVEDCRTPLFFGPFMWKMGPFRRVYRIDGRDQDWRQYKGWVCVGRSWWFSQSVEQCPVEVKWDS